MAAGRPRKSKDEVKSEAATVKLTKQQKEDIILLFGSVKEFFRVAVVTLVKKKGVKNG